MKGLLLCLSSCHCLEAVPTPSLRVENNVLDVPIHESFKVYPTVLGCCPRFRPGLQMFLLKSCFRFKMEASRSEWKSGLIRCAFNKIGGEKIDVFEGAAVGSSVQHEVYMRGKTQGHTHLLGCQQLPLGSLFGSKISACTVLMGFCLLFQFPFFFVRIRSTDVNYIEW